MARQFAAQAALTLLSLLIVSAIVFWLVELLPGDTATRILGQNATPEAVAVLTEKLGLDRPATTRYVEWLGNALTGEFGQSLVADRPVSEYIAGRALNTTILAAFALALYVPLSLALGMITAVTRGSVVDTGITVFVLLGMCIPDFVIAIFLVTIFAIGLDWFPPLALIDRAEGMGDLLWMLFLPAVTLTAAMTAYAVRMMRESLIQILESDYVQMAGLKGLPRWRILFRHALPNALGPALSVTALNVAWLIGSIVLVETVFNFPGLGRLLIDAISYKDSPVVLAISLLLCVVYAACNLLADLAIVALNPKLRASR